MSDKPEPTRLYVRFSTKDDVDRVIDFYKDNRHQHVGQRDPNIVSERVKSGSVTLIEDAQGKIVASSISYPVMATDENGADIHKWTEVGSTRITLDGIGLFNVLISAQMVHAFLLEPPEDRFIMEIEKANSHSRHVFNKLGGIAFDEVPKGMAETATKAFLPESQNMDVIWLHYDLEGIPHLARIVENRIDHPHLKNTKTGEEYVLDFSKCQLETMFKDAVHELAKADFGDPKAPDMTQSLAKKSREFKP